MPTDIAFDVALFFWTCIVSIFFRVVQARGSWRIPKQKDGPVIFVAAPHHNQFLDPLLLASEVRRASGRRVAFLIAEKSIKRKFVGAAARIMQSIPVARAADSAKSGSGLITVHPDDPTILLGLNTRFTKELMPKGQIQLPKFTSFASAEIVEIISDTEVKIKKPFTNDKAKAALRGEVPSPTANGAANAAARSEKARAANKNDAKDVGSWEGKKGCKYKALPFIDQTMMYASVYERLAEGGSLGIFPEGGSHDRTDLLPLKAGVVIMALGAMAENPGLKVRIVPVGLHYFHADKFRSRAVIEFGAPMEVPQDSVAMFKEGGEGKKKAVGQCMDLVFDGLKSVTVRAPDYETLMLIQAGRRLYTPSGTHTSLGQVVELNRRFIMGYNKFKDEPRVIALKEDVLKYNRMLSAYGLRDHQVERAHRAGWRSLGLLFYRIGLLCIWSTLALPGVVLNAPIFILAKIISRRKAKEALAASQVKLQGRDVLATWKVLVSLGVTPVLYTFYAVMATMYARKQGWITTWRGLFATPLYTYMALPLMSYSALKVGENSIDIYKSLPPLVVSLAPGSHKAIKRIQETRTRLAANLHKLIDELAPQVFDDFDSYR
ncbi:Glycerol-3-phosphate/dihydroxyacetone phosphate acyltransferase [Tilletia horrida]|nr:Glycerol-3-phosphate/dihydroxyacetone phosphate acyltransferase [Tilletia horrida]